MYVNNWLTRRASLTPDKTALVDTLDGDRRITYREWNSRVNSTANFLREDWRLNGATGWRCWP